MLPVTFPTLPPNFSRSSFDIIRPRNRHRTVPGSGRGFQRLVGRLDVHSEHPTVGDPLSFGTRWPAKNQLGRDFVQKIAQIQTIVI